MSTPGPDPRAQNFGDAADFAQSRQEDQDRALFARDRFERHARDLVLDTGAWVSTDIARQNRISAARAFDERRIAEERAHPRAVERRRHDQKPQVLAQALLGVKREREAEIGVERALMELVEQHRRDPLERGIIENLPREHALGDDLDACALRDKALQAHAQADRLADFFA